MKERPILFSGAMVRSILEGRKTQTRRIVSPQPALDERGLLWWNWSKHAGSANIDHPGQPSAEWLARCRYGVPGDRLWVRETWAQPAALDPGPTVYRADYPACVPTGFENIPPADAITWKPSIHMPRAVSRILLEVTGVRVERLQECSFEDALAEGIPDYRQLLGEECSQGESADECARRLRWPQRQYAQLWNEINGPGAWKANPWVWVVEFRKA